ncbi:uncharacterized protein LOC113291870 [Papaver somniferum]|uniref:uncharacterized protein LOC113291870 n=1 Tax=Papaver somniferum TaxID=3469 RepID=UPI000E7037DC|nr:uncharacterized protein LOC113291870 [Papaver somniferum]
MVVAEFKFCNQTVSHLVSGSTTVKEMISVVKQKWPYVPEDLKLFGYTVDGISNVINHDLDLRFFIHYCSSQEIDLLKFKTQLRTCVDSISSSSSSAPASSSSSSCISSYDVVVVEDVTNDACLIKKVPKKYDAWVNILTGVAQLFEGGNFEVKDYFIKYEICSGRKYNLVKSDFERYTVECKFKEEENCRWRFHASILAKSNGVFQCKRYIAEHSCSLACSDPSKVRMRKSFMKNILSDDLRTSKKKKTAYDVIDLIRMEYGVDLTYSQAYHGLQFTKQFLWGDDIKSYSYFVCFHNWFQQLLTSDAIYRLYLSHWEVQRWSYGCLRQNWKPSGLRSIQLHLEWFPVKMVRVGNGSNLKGIIREDRPLTIISDCGNDILKHVPEVFPNAYHSYYLYHMKGNILVPKGKSTQTAVKLFEECYTALTKEKIYAAAKSMSNLKLNSVVAWMMKISFENWASHAFLVERWGENTSNIAESFNNFIKHDKAASST